MQISYDPAKQRRTLDERGLEDAPKVFEGFTLTWPDMRMDTVKFARSPWACSIYEWLSWFGRTDPIAAASSR